MGLKPLLPLEIDCAPNFFYGGKLSSIEVPPALTPSRRSEHEGDEWQVFLYINLEPPGLVALLCFFNRVPPSRWCGVSSPPPLFLSCLPLSLVCIFYQACNTSDLTFLGSQCRPSSRRTSSILPSRCSERSSSIPQTPYAAHFAPCYSPHQHGVPLHVVS